MHRLKVVIVKDLVTVEVLLYTRHCLFLIHIYLQVGGLLYFSSLRESNIELTVSENRDA